MTLEPAPRKRPREQAVSDAEFVTALKPMVQAIETLGGAHHRMDEVFGYHSTAESRAMAELAEEASLAAWGWSQPVLYAHTSVGFYTVAGMDHLRAFAHLFSSPPIHIYAPLVLARAAVEAFAWAKWLGDPSLPVEVRVMRGQLALVSDCRERARFPEREIKKRAKKTAARVWEGVPHGWTVVNKKDEPLQIGTERLPRIRSVISVVMPKPVGPSGEQIDSGLWSVLCGTAHASQFALTMAMDVPPQGSDLEPVLAGLSITSTTANLIGGLILRAAITASEAKFQLFGWDSDPDWRSAVKQAQGFISALGEPVSESG